MALGEERGVLTSRTGVPLTRATTYRFTLDVNQAQHQTLLAHAGAARMTFNHHLARVKANLGSGPPNAPTASQKLT